MIKKLPDEETNSTAPDVLGYKDVRAFDNHGYVKDNKVNNQRSFFYIIGLFGYCRGGTS